MDRHSKKKFFFIEEGALLLLGLAFFLIFPLFYAFVVQRKAGGLQTWSLWNQAHKAQPNLTPRVDTP